nr:DUF4185 domain-containing protein [Propionibacterium sp.]
MSPLIGPGSLLQGTIPADRRPASLVRLRRLEAVVLSAGGDQLVHYHRDQTRPDRPWVAGEVISERPAGPGAIGQEPGGWRDPGPLHVLVPEWTDADVALGHHVRTNARNRSHRWRRIGELPGEDATLRLVRGRLLARVRRDGVSRVLALDRGRWREVPDAAWPAGAASGGLDADRPAVDPFGPDAVAVALAPTALAGLPGVGGLAAALPGGDGALAAPVLAPGGRGWWQALVQEGASVHQWHRQEWAGRVRWVRAACLRFDPRDGFGVEPVPSRKLAQVTGERDTQPGAADATLSFSESRSGVRGTDLGVRVDHGGRSYLLFGDTHWRAPWRTTLDALGRVDPTGPLPGLPGVEVHGAPTRIRGGLATHREYDVPLDGFSAEGHLYVLFSSHHFQRHQVMGRSLLTRLDAPAPAVRGAERRRPIVFTKVGTFSDRYFVNVSVQRRGDRLYLWGSGSYRADDLRLAELDLTAPTVGVALRGEARWTRPLPGLRFWAGQQSDNTAPTWSPHEDDARPVLPGAFGEISVRWVPELGRYVLLAMAGPEDPIGPSVTLRTAPTPWGPWTPRLRLFDWVERGMSFHDEASRFIRAHHDGDPVGDRIFAMQAAMTGAAYAPYLFDARRDGDRVVLRYTLSTWNPYQVVLMEHRLAPGFTGGTCA